MYNSISTTFKCTWFVQISTISTNVGTMLKSEHRTSSHWVGVYFKENHQSMSFLVLTLPSLGT